MSHCIMRHLKLGSGPFCSHPGEAGSIPAHPLARPRALQTIADKDDRLSVLAINIVRSIDRPVDRLIRFRSANPSARHEPWTLTSPLALRLARTAARRGRWPRRQPPVPSAFAYPSRVVMVLGRSRACQTYGCHILTLSCRGCHQLRLECKLAPF